MKLTEYIDSQEMFLEDFLNLDEEQALAFDFLTQGDEADRTNLIKAIYHRIFPWYDETKQKGDTLNTYRIAIKQYYGNYYRFLNRDIQLEIIDIIKKYTPHHENHIFEFEETDKNGNTYFQLCNNYQLGNFGILPTRGGINPKRAKEPYLDFFDDFMVVIGSFYDGDILQNDELKIAIMEQKSYFDQFENFSNYIENNYLHDFLGEDEEGNSGVLDLSGSRNFEEYVATVTEIITNRGSLIWNVLKGEMETKESYSDDSSNQLATEILQNSMDLKERCSIDENTAQKMAKLLKVEEYIDERVEIYYEYRNEIGRLEDEYQNKINEESSKSLIKKFGWTKWWYWIILFFVSYFAILMLKEHYIRNIYGVEYQKLEMVYLLSKIYYSVFWIALISKIVYNFKFFKKDIEFSNAQENKIENLKNDLNEEVDTLEKMCNEKIGNYDNLNYEIIQFSELIPSNYRNKNDINKLTGFIFDGRADNFKEAYELLEKHKHRERVEEQARKAAWAAEEAAIEQRESARRAAQAAIDTAERQARAAEDQAQAARDQAWETERHNRKVEEKWNR